MPKSCKGYDFDYKVADGLGNIHYHKEEEADDKGIVKGTYGYKDIQGLYRVVDYIADTSGFHAKIRTNEPGTDGKSSAYVEMVAEKPTPVFRGNYDEPVRIHQDKRIRGQNQYKDRTQTVNKDNELHMEYMVPETMFAAVNRGYVPSSYSGSIPDKEEEEEICGEKITVDLFHRNKKNIKLS